MTSSAEKVRQPEASEANMRAVIFARVAGLLTHAPVTEENVKRFVNLFDTIASRPSHPKNEEDLPPSSNVNIHI